MIAGTICPWCRASNSRVARYCVECSHRCDVERKLCDCGRIGCLKRDAGADYRRARIVRGEAPIAPAGVTPMTDEQLAIAKARLELLYGGLDGKRRKGSEDK